MKSLEDTIRQLQQKYKNSPSPLSEQYIKSNSNTTFISQQPVNTTNVRNVLLGNFKPSKDTFR